VSIHLVVLKTAKLRRTSFLNKKKWRHRAEGYAKNQ